MVTEKRIRATLDQLSNSVEFDSQTESKGVTVAGGQGATKAAQQEDSAGQPL
jgi:hypothetical protein